MVYSVAANLWFQFVVHIMLFPMVNVLYFYVSTFRRMDAVLIMAVFCYADYYFVYCEFIVVTNTHREWLKLMPGDVCFSWTTASNFAE